MPETKLEKEVSEIHRDVGEIKEAVAMLADSYIEAKHAELEKEKASFISLQDYRQKHAIRG